MITISKIQEIYIQGFHDVLDSVSREKKYLAWSEAPPIESTRAFVLQNIKNGIPQMVALDDDKVIGWCDIEPHPRQTRKHCGTLGMGILQAYRHQGIGTRLITATIAEARQVGLEKIELEVFEGNSEAIALYRKLGFTFEGRRAADVKIDGVYIDCLLMALFLKDSLRNMAGSSQKSHI